MSLDIEHKTSGKIKISNKNKLNKDKKTALHYMDTLVDVVRESFLILDDDLKVLAANSIFLDTFKVKIKDVLDISLYQLGNGQWDIPEFKKLLEKVLPEKKVVINFEVEHTFETIGKRIMLLNARQIDTVQLIIIAIEDITGRKKSEKLLENNAQKLEILVKKRTTELADRINSLEILNKNMVGRELKMIEMKKEIKDLKRRIINGK